MVFPIQCRLFAMEKGRETFTSYLLHPRHPRAVYRRLEILREVAKGVGRLHRSGYCHRDLKPDNILRCHADEVKIADLGTCRLHSGVDPIATDYSLPAGDMLYSAPEMFASGALMPELYVGADWFSFGAILFEALTGQNLYVGIGLRDPYEIKHTIAAAADMAGYMRQVGTAVGLYPVPAISDYRERWLEPLSDGTLAGLTRLVRDLAILTRRADLQIFVESCLASTF